VREQFEKYWEIDQFEDQCSAALIADVKQPFDRQPKQIAEGPALYDGFALQRILCPLISSVESDIRHIHVAVTDKLLCTFDDDDWRYHARTVVCGTPSFVSTPGIIEGPAKPKEYYYRSGPWQDTQSLNKRFAGRFVDYGDARLDQAVLMYIYQAIFFFITDGMPFCGEKTCRLYNAHWQEELIGNISNSTFCRHHDRLLKIFNERNGN
jgi:hypothetical protein